MPQKPASVEIKVLHPSTRNDWIFILIDICIFHLQIKQTQDEEKKQLTALRDLIKSSLQLDQKEVSRFAPRSAHPDPNQTQTEHSTSRPDSLAQMLSSPLLSFWPLPGLELGLQQHRASAQCCTMLVASVW